jgi:hypothetical protein
VRPLILLDVDGVLNISQPVPGDGCSSLLLLAGGRGAQVTIRDDLRTLLDRLALSGDLVWASGWNDGAPALFSVLVPWVKAMPHLEFESTGNMVEKLPVVRDYVGDRSVAWLDDRIPEAAWAWAESRDAPTLLVAIDPDVGFGPDDLAHVERWAAEQSAIASAASAAPGIDERENIQGVR